MSEPNVHNRPSSEGGWSEDILTLTEATVVPPLASDFVQPSGILDRHGNYCAHGALWRKHRPITVAPRMPEQAPDRLAGRWLWGGVLWSHFGHFLAESTARLWALDYLDAPVDGVLFVPKRPRVGDNLKSFHQPFFDLTGMKVPFRVAAEPLRVDELVVPGQGFGIGEISAGTPRYRASALGHLGRDIKPEGPERLYISRSALGYTRGSILGERYVEERLAEEGYAVFHPQKHPLDVQLARYRAARRVVATDGSALHLLAMTGTQGQRVAVIARRKSRAVDYLVRHVEHFTGMPPLHLLSLRRSWLPEGRGKAKRLSLAELNLPRIGAGLTEAGFIGNGSAWQNLPDTEVEGILQETGQTWQMPAWLIRQLAREGVRTLC